MPIYDCEDCPDLDTCTTCELKWVKLTTYRKHALLIGTYYPSHRLKICNNWTYQCLKYSIQIYIKKNKLVKYFWEEISTLEISTGPWVAAENQR